MPAGDSKHRLSAFFESDSDSADSASSVDEVLAAYLASKPALTNKAQRSVAGGSDQCVPVGMACHAPVDPMPAAVHAATIAAAAAAAAAGVPVTSETAICGLHPPPIASTHGDGVHAGAPPSVVQGGVGGVGPGLFPASVGWCHSRAPSMSALSPAPIRVVSVCHYPPLRLQGGMAVGAQVGLNGIGAQVDSRGFWDRSGASVLAIGGTGKLSSSGTGAGVCAASAQAVRGDAYPERLHSGPAASSHQRWSVAAGPALPLWSSSTHHLLRPGWPAGPPPARFPPNHISSQVLGAQAALPGCPRFATAASHVPSPKGSDCSGAPGSDSGYALDAALQAAIIAASAAADSAAAKAQSGSGSSGAVVPHNSL